MKVQVSFMIEIEGPVTKAEPEDLRDWVLTLVQSGSLSEVPNQPGVVDMGDFDVKVLR